MSLGGKKEPLLLVAVFVEEGFCSELVGVCVIWTAAVACPMEAEGELERRETGVGVETRGVGKGAQCGVLAPAEV